MKVSIIGTGYVGLVTGVCLAVKGHEVICVDKEIDKVNAINKAESYIYEPNIKELLKEAVSDGKLSATTDLSYAVTNSEISIITVGTPYNNEYIDLSALINVLNELGTILKDKKDYHVVCIKSTVIPSTTDNLVKIILEYTSDKMIGKFGLVMNPEFLRAGNAIQDFMNPDRIIIGTNDDKSFIEMSRLYSCFQGIPIIRVNTRTAEMIKYTSNALFSTIISFSNEIASICELVENVDSDEVLEAVLLDNRINPRINHELLNPGIIKYFKAGCGFGGSCFTKDVKSLISFCKEKKYQPLMLRSVIEINKSQYLKLINKLEQLLGDLKDKKIVVLGLAFKPDTDDIRESASIAIIKTLIKKKAKVCAVDPVAVDNAKEVLPNNSNISFTTDINDALSDADAAILLTAWDEFVNIQPKQFMDLMKIPIVIDGRGAYNKEDFLKNKIQYYKVGFKQIYDYVEN